MLEHRPQGKTLLERYGWGFLCYFLLPACFLGFIGAFTFHKKTIITPSLLLVGGSMIVVAGLAFRWGKLRNFPLFWPLVGYLGAVILSGIPSVSRLHWARGLLEVGLAFCFLLYPYFFLRNRRQLDRCLYVLIALAVAAVTFAALQIFYFNSLPRLMKALYRVPDIWWIWNWTAEGRMVGNWIHPGFLSSILNLIAPLPLYFYFREKRARRFFWLTVYCFLAGGLLLANTRTSAIALGCSALSLAYLMRVRQRAVLALLCALALGIVLPPLAHRFGKPVFILQEEIGDTDILGRFALFDTRNLRTIEMRRITQRVALQLFRSHPLFGIGMRNYGDRAAKLDPMARYSVHNIIVQHLAETGLLGIAAFTILILAALRCDFQPDLRKFGDLQFLRYAFLASSAAVLLETLAKNSLYIWQVAAIFWLVRGLSLTVASRPEAFSPAE